MQEVVDAMTGDPIKDIEIIADILEENQDHPDIESIGFELLARITDRIPKQAKKEMARIIEENHRAIEEQISQVEDLIEDEMYDQALEKIEKLFRTFELLQMFNEENIFHFYTFEDGLQESIYRVLHNIQTPTGNAPENYAKAYAVYGKVLLHLNRYDQAIEKYQQALRWNPMSISSYLALCEILKRQGKMDVLKEQLDLAFRYAYRKEDIGDIYCFLSSLYLEQEEYELAHNTAFFASFFVRKSKANKYMSRVKEACPYHLADIEPGTLTKLFEDNKISKAPSEEMLRVMFSIANYCESHNRLRECMFVWRAIHDLIEDQESSKRIDELENKLLEKFEEILNDYMEHPCERKFNRILLEMHGLNVWVAQRNDSKDEYAIATKEDQTYFAAFTRKEMDPTLTNYKPVKVVVEQVVQWAYESQDEVVGIVFNPHEDGLTLETDELSDFVQKDLMN